MYLFHGTNERKIVNSILKSGLYCSEMVEEPGSISSKCLLGTEGYGIYGKKCGAKDGCGGRCPVFLSSQPQTPYWGFSPRFWAKHGIRTLWISESKEDGYIIVVELKKDILKKRLIAINTTEDWWFAEGEGWSSDEYTNWVKRKVRAELGKNMAKDEEGYAMVYWSTRKQFEVILSRSLKTPTKDCQVLVESPIEPKYIIGAFKVWDGDKQSIVDRFNPEKTKQRFRKAFWKYILHYKKIGKTDPYKIEHF